MLLSLHTQRRTATFRKLSSHLRELSSQPAYLISIKFLGLFIYLINKKNILNKKKIFGESFQMFKSLLHNPNCSYYPIRLVFFFFFFTLQHFFCPSHLSTMSYPELFPQNKQEPLEGINAEKLEVFLCHRSHSRCVRPERQSTQSE